MDMEPAKTIVEYLGGARVVANIIRKHPSRVYRWMYSLEKREGCGGIVPLRDQQRILEYCMANGIDLRRDDFFSSDRIAALVLQDKIESPVSSSAGDAGASLPPSDAPASLLQDETMRAAE
ncbi:hypothetical protein GJU93_10780 [Brucella sp. 10RB9212]|uniref:hypothetical protein n=1 Tax=unclassified Brucella TaxID=2632610 RepID=UPI0009728C0C|nr:MULTISPECIES: hypothetical protein [unclassified Brucella]APY12983.1 hypothetical protein BKD02_00510 [Brucella sp. 09RB8910]MRN47075.1 hypothetical protein [Brucella sp. 10RB9212]